MKIKNFYNYLRNIILLNYNYNLGFITILPFLLFVGMDLLTSFVYYKLLIFSLVLCYFFYDFLYTIKGLNKSLVSYIFIYIFNIIFYFYLLSFYVLYIGVSHPIYVKDLSKISQYKYLILCIFCIVICYVYIKKKNIYMILMYPYLKEEIYKILTCWNDDLFGPFFSKMLDKLQNIKFQKIYMSFYFLIFVFCRLIVLLLFVNFVFFNGDFRYVLYVSPFLFISWFLSFIVYYFEKFFYIEKDYIKNLLDVKPINPVKSLDNGIIFTYENNLTFSLTNYAIKEGYTRVDILARIWLNFSNLDLFFFKYKKFIIKFSLFCLFIQIICWITLTITFFLDFQYLA